MWGAELTADTLQQSLQGKGLCVRSSGKDQIDPVIREALFATYISDWLEHRVPIFLPNNSRSAARTAGLVVTAVVGGTLAYVSLPNPIDFMITVCVASFILTLLLFVPNAMELEYRSQRERMLFEFGQYAASIWKETGQEMNHENVPVACTNAVNGFIHGGRWPLAPKASERSRQMRAELVGYLTSLHPTPEDIKRAIREVTQQWAAEGGGDPDLR